MNDERLAELRALADAATPGPWNHDSLWLPNSILGPVHQPDDSDTTEEVLLFADPDFGHKPQDLAFIAASRTAIPELLDEIERLRERTNRVKALRKKITHSKSHWFYLGWNDALDAVLFELAGGSHKT